jgi:membrane protein
MQQPRNDNVPLIGLRAVERAQEPHRGRQAESPSDIIPPPNWKDIILRVYQNIGKHRVIALAAGVAFYALLAIFPAIAALVAIYGFFADPATISAHLDSVAGLLPGGAIDIIRDQMTRIASHGKSTLGLTFAFGLGVSLWSANAGMKAIIDALNLVYNEEEKRGFIKLNVVSLTFTVLAIIFLLLSIAAIAVVPVVLAYVGLGAVTATLVNYGRWPILFIVVAAGLAALYRYGPSRSRPKWRWITWGSSFAAVAWMLVSLLFSWYAANFGSYNETYGSLGAVIGFMMWLWLSAIVLLLGAELDAEMEHQTAKDTTSGRPKPMGEPGAHMADTLGAAQRIQDA